MINIDSILKKTKKYAGSSAGKNKIQQLREKAFDRNESFGVSNGSGIVSKEGFVQASKQYLELLKNYKDARFSPALYDIIAQTVANATVSQPTKVGKGLYKVSINFNPELLRRESIVGYYTGDYIENILALFNNGMDIKNGQPPIGWWDSHGIRIRAVSHRDSLLFMQNTTREFMNINKKLFDIKSIDIGEIYKR